MKKLVLGFSLALLLLVGLTVKVNAQSTDAMMQTSASISAPLAIGSQGTDVTALQQFLIAKGYLQVAAPTGFYGNMTAQAVSVFQGANNLPQVGRVGPKTLSLLEQMLNGTNMQSSSDLQADAGVGEGMHAAASLLQQSGCPAGTVYSTTTGEPCNPGTPSFPAGCTSASGYSSTTGLPCDGTTSTPTPNGCPTGTVYSTTTGLPCNPNSSAFPAGCNSASGYSSTTGLPCDGSTVTTFPAGCTSASGYSSTTGLPCSNTTMGGNQQNSCASNSSPSIIVVSPNGGETYTAGQQITVSWTSCNIPAGDLVNINLLRPDPTSGSYTAHVATTPDASNTFPVSNGSAPITITATGVWPTTVQYGNVYKILLDVLAPSSGGMGDTGALVTQGWSANSFTIGQ